MKLIRIFLNWLVAGIALIVLLGAFAFVPLVQTWVAQTELAKQPELKGSLGSFSAGFGKIAVDDLHLELGGTVLTVPSLEVRLPLISAARTKKFPVRSLIAQGWTLDLSHHPAGKNPRAQNLSGSGAGGPTRVPANAEATPAQAVANAFRGVLNGWKIPWDGSFDGVDLEGDVLLATPAGMPPARVHVTLKGGGMAPGREGTFAFGVAISAPGIPINGVGARGQLVVAMASAGSVNRVEFNAALSSRNGALPENLTLSGAIAAVPGARTETYTLDLSQRARHLAIVSAVHSDRGGPLRGNWKVDGQDSDWRKYFPDQPLPSLEVSGDGSFDSDPAFQRVHADGHLKVIARRLGTLAPGLNPFGTVTLGAAFDVVRAGHSLNFDQLEASLGGGARPAATARSLQAFAIDEQTGDIKAADPSRDWMEISVRGGPLARLAGFTGGFTLSGGDATGEFVVRTAGDGFDLRPQTPLTATGITLRRADQILAQGLDLSVSLHASYSPRGWQVRGAPFAIGVAGREVASVEATASRPGGDDQPIALTANWKTDLAALTALPGIGKIGWIAGRSASGEFTGSVAGASAQVSGKLSVIGHDPSRSLSATAQAEVSSDGAAAFKIPIKISFGSDVTEFAAEGNRAGNEAGGRIEVALTGANVTLEQLQLLAAPLAAAIGASPAEAPANARSAIPFWGAWVGRATVDFDHFRAGASDLQEVNGTFEVDHGSVHAKGVRLILPHQCPAQGEGSITFDPNAVHPYQFNGTAAIPKVDAAWLFAAAEHNQNPSVEGHFSVTGTLTGNGSNWADLVRRAQEEFRLTSSATIIRLLKTSVADTIPEIQTPVSDALGTAGSLVGSLFGYKGHSIESGKNTVSKTAEAVLNFTDLVAEIGFDQVTFTAIRDSDCTFRLVDLTMTSPDECLTGSGTITNRKGLPICAEPLSLDLRFGARGDLGKLLSAAGLLSAQKDKLGYTALNQPIHLSGTLEHPDASQWHDLLAKAANQQPVATKKTN